MSRSSLYKTLNIAALLIFCSISSNAYVYADTASDLKDLLAENEQESRLPEYKDNETTLKMKLEILNTVNNNRARHGLGPLKLDIFACRVASKTASEAAKGKYFGHWNLRGEKPYHRYAFSGGTDHVSENASMRWSSFPMTNKYSEVFKYIIDAHMAMYNETPPNDGHRKNILNPSHTHVGLGFSMIEKDFRYYELYVDRYLSFNKIDQQVHAGDEVTVSGRCLAAGYGVFYIIVYYEPYPSPMSRSEIETKGSYPDFTNSIATNLPFWEIEYDDSSKKFKFSFKTGQKGLYYVHTFIKKGHTGKERPGTVSTRGLTPASGIVIRAE